MGKGPLLKFTDKFFDVLVDVGTDVSNSIMSLEGNPLIENSIEIEEVDNSKHDYYFEVKIDGEWSRMNIEDFIDYFLYGAFEKREIREFIKKYNSIKSGDLEEDDINVVEVPDFVWNPKDVRQTFISLVTETYPHGHEEEVVPFISGAGLQKDEFGNYYKIIGKSETMFTSHLDTADRKKSKVTIHSKIVDGDEILCSDGTTILGADDKSGVSVMLYMIAHNIPGIYYFFIGEERGGIGSGKVSSVFESTPHLKGVKRCVSFDRRNYFSIITEQMCMECCSEEFAQALANQYNSNGMQLRLDPTGIYTDSASFIEQIPECTNISVGYFDEHTTKERQNITFLKKLAEASIKVKWEELPTTKKLGLDEDILERYGKFISDMKSTAFNMDYKIATDRGRTYVKIDMDEPEVELVSDDLYNISILLNKHKMNPPITFDDDLIKIELEKKKSLFSSGAKFNKFLDSYNRFNESWDDDLDDLDNPFDKRDKDSENEGEMGELSYWVREMFRSNNLLAEVENDNYDLSVYVFLEKTERMSKLLNLFEVVEKISTDLLSYYNAEVELYENKEGFPVFKFNFTWDRDEDDEE
jgi:hypothetical protein